uniref:Uncharacterized protein n=1 Tax=Anguilla anguilla TaxID=7936 RepID=A0A0E9SQ12_ANGAN
MFGDLYIRICASTFCCVKVRSVTTL